MPKKGEKSPVKGRTYEKEVYTPDEIRELLRYTASNASSAIRNHALIVVLWQSGLRIDEALNLRPDDFNTKDNEIFVRHAKTGRRGGPSFRRVRCGNEASAEVDRWMGRRTALGLPKKAPLFCTLAGTKLADTYFRTTLNRLARRAGWEKRIHPHGFRHTFAVNLALSGVPPAVIQRQLGHTSLNTTSIYLQAISTEDIAEAMEGVSW